jgi:hypothetical protein
MGYQGINCGADARQLRQYLDQHSKGIGVYDGTRVHDYNRAHGLDPVAINGPPFVDKNDNIWFGSMAGLIKINCAKAFEKPYHRSCILNQFRSTRCEFIIVKISNSNTNKTT